MLKNISTLGKSLNKAQLLVIKGGRIPDLSQVCGYIVFNSIQSQCLGLDPMYQPLWNASNNTCSALGSNTDCDDELPFS